MVKKIKIIIIAFIANLLFMIPMVNAQTMGEITRMATDNLDGFLSMYIDPWTNGNTDVGLKNHTHYCMDPFEHGTANHGSMRTAVVDVGLNGISSVNGLSTTNSEAARRAMEVLYYATKSYANQEPWGKTGSSPYRLMMMQSAAKYSSVMVGGGLFNSSLPGGVTEDYMKQQFGSNKYNQLKAEGEAYVNGTMNYAFADQSPQGKQTIEEVGDWIFVGPYRIQNTGSGYISDITVKTMDGSICRPDGWSTETKTDQINLNKSLPNGTEFYLAFNTQKPDSAEEIKVTKRVDNALRARMVFYGSDGGQNMATYGGKLSMPAEQTINLPKVPFSQIKIMKKDSNSGWGIENVGFLVYYETEGKWVYDGTPAKYVDSKEEAIEHMYKTNKNGEVTIRNLNKKGTYKIYEVLNPNFGYAEATIENPSEERTIEMAAIGQTIKEEIGNRRLYVKLSGYVWEDRITSTKKTGNNNLYADNETDDRDKRVKNVTVTLRNAQGEVIDTRVTNTITNTKGEQEEGAYLFGDYQRDPTAKKIEIEQLEGAYIQFKYNGMCYKSVPVNIGKDNGSKATDDNLRDKFNNDYATITKGVAQNSGYRLNYDREYLEKTSTSTINYGGTYLYGYEGQEKPISGIDKQYLLIANTLDAAPDNLLGQAKYTIDNIYEEKIEEVPNINLGVKARGMPNLSVFQDVKEVKIGLNGYEHLYQYGNRLKTLEQQIEEFKKKYPGEEIFQMGVNFAAKYESASQPYSRTVYASDVIYDSKQENKGKLEIYVTYDIRLCNESDVTNSKINQLYNYFDRDYEIMTLREEERKTENQKVTVVNTKDITSSIKERTEYKDKWDRILIEPENGIQLKTDSDKYLVLTYKLSDDAIINLLNGNKTLDSATEIVSYSSYDDANFTHSYAGIDVNSEPNNEDIGNRKTYEDDIDQAPSLILDTDKNRTIKGNVWQEEAIEELLTEADYYKKQRLGNGQYEANKEKVIKDVTVELLRVNSEEDKEQAVEPKVATLYAKNLGEEKTKEARANTDEKGGYQFEGVIPGQYILKFTYHDKSVLYQLDGTRCETLEDNGGVEYYKSTLFRTTADKVGNINQEAYQKAQQSMYWYFDETKEAARLSDARDKKELVEERTSVETINYEEAMKTINTLDAISAESSKLEIKMDCNQDDLLNISQSGRQLKFIFDNLDFGIIRRPKQPLKLTKEISYVEVVLTNGQVVISGDPRKGPIKHLKLLPNNNVHIEIDDEIIQGATLRIKYEIKVDNRECEIDYNDMDYYYFGKLPINYKDRDKWKIATITDLFDYPDNGLNFNLNYDKSDNNKWDYLDLKDLQENKNIAPGLKEILKRYNVILHTDKFASMEPGQEKIETMVLTKLLSNMDTDLSFDNKVEVNTYNGRKMDYTVPGNYDPVEGKPDEEDNSGKNLVITGPTGGNQSDVSYVLLGITVLIVFVTGIVLIKKKVLDE